MADIQIRDTASVNLTDNADVLEAEVKISATAGNTITVNADGIFASAAASAAPSGAAGGALSGTYPNPGVNAQSVANAIDGDATAIAVITDAVLDRMQNDAAYAAAFCAAIPTTITEV